MTAPTCLHCGKPLRKYRYRDADFAKGFEEYGNHGDNLFCNKEHAYRWSTTVLGLYDWNDARTPYTTFEDASFIAKLRTHDCRAVKLAKETQEVKQ